MTILTILTSPKAHREEKSLLATKSSAVGAGSSGLRKSSRNTSAGLRSISGSWTLTTTWSEGACAVFSSKESQLRMQLPTTGTATSAGTATAGPATGDDTTKFVLRNEATVPNINQTSGCVRFASIGFQSRPSTRTAAASTLKRSHLVDCRQEAETWIPPGGVVGGVGRGVAKRAQKPLRRPTQTQTTRRRTLKRFRSLLRRDLGLNLRRVLLWGRKRGRRLPRRRRQPRRTLLLKRLILYLFYLFN